MRRRWLVAVSLLVWVSSAAPARADTLLIPFFGINFGGDSGKSFSDSFDSNRFNWGVSFAFMGAGVFGVEGDFSYSPDFFGQTDIGGSSVMTGTGSLLVGIPFGGQTGFGVRPYGVAGAGVIRTEADFGGLDGDETEVAWSAGGGVMLFFGTRMGMRVDFRYFRTFDALDLFGIELIELPGDLDFTRTSFGLVIRF